MNWTVIQQRLAGRGINPGPNDGEPGGRTYAALFQFFRAGNNAPLLAASANATFGQYFVDTGPRLAHWLAQFSVESGGFSCFEESLNYSAPRLCAVWPKRFPTIDAAVPYAGDPERLAEKVYGGRMGNLSPGDGWRYRGRGPGLTGRDNYAACAKGTGLPLIQQPDLAADPRNFVLIACDFWGAGGCNRLADQDDLEAVTEAVNGGHNGIDQRAAILAKAKELLL